MLALVLCTATGVILLVMAVRSGHHGSGAARRAVDKSVRRARPRARPFLLTHAGWLEQPLVNARRVKAA